MIATGRSSSLEGSGAAVGPGCSDSLAWPAAECFGKQTNPVVGSKAINAALGKRGRA